MSYFIENTLEQIHDDLISGRRTVQDLVDESKRILDARNKEVNALVDFYSDINEQVLVAQKRIDKGNATFLTGIPIAVKDNILRKGQRVTASSKILRGYVAPYSATAIEKLAEENPIFIGRTNMDEFAMGGSTETSCYGVTKNPHDEKRVAGGSSGGSAAIVAMGVVPIALGSDTGGSVRQPASFCGVVGVKPTYGAVSRYGLMAMGSSLDQIGVFTHHVNDAEYVLQKISGQDNMDSTTFRAGAYSKEDTNNKTVGIIKEVVEKFDDSTKKNVDEAIKKLEDQGVAVSEVSLPHFMHSLACYYIIMPAEASTNLARYDGVKFGYRSDDFSNLQEMYKSTRSKEFGQEVKRRILLGTYVLSSGYFDAYYKKATSVRAVITNEVQEIFKTVDALLLPTTTGVAFSIGENDKDPLSMYLGDVYTVSANIIGVPGISVPFGGEEIDGKTLPLGMQILAAKGDEKSMFTVAKKLQA
jgi:aspartyl-tRNA(Asn)/glutamyl-tRNA(Gln) amidotransferase subunit A